MPAKNRQTVPIPFTEGSVERTGTECSCSLCSSRRRRRSGANSPRIVPFSTLSSPHAPSNSAGLPGIFFVFLLPSWASPPYLPHCLPGSPVLQGVASLALPCANMVTNIHPFTTHIHNPPPSPMVDVQHFMWEELKVKGWGEVLYLHLAQGLWSVMYLMITLFLQFQPKQEVIKRQKEEWTFNCKWNTVIKLEFSSFCGLAGEEKRRE